MSADGEGDDAALTGAKAQQIAQEVLTYFPERNPGIGQRNNSWLVVTGVNEREQNDELIKDQAKALLREKIKESTLLKSRYNDVNFTEEVIDEIMKQINVGSRSDTNDGYAQVEISLKSPKGTDANGRYLRGVPEQLQEEAQRKGGIDFNEQYLQMNGQQDLDSIRIDGLVPVIFSIQPATTLAVLQ